MKSVISLVDSLVRSSHATSQSSGPLLVLRCEKVFIQFAHCYCFEAGLRSKRFRVVSEQRATEEWRVTGFSVWAARKMERAAIFLAVFDPHSSFFALKPHGNARVIRVLLFSAQKWPLLIASRSWERFTKRCNDGQRRKARLYSAARNSFFSAYETYCGLLQAFVVGMAQKDVIRKNSKISLLNYLIFLTFWLRAALHYLNACSWNRLQSKFKLEHNLDKPL